MSRSRHQRHKLFKDKHPNPFRRRKRKPFGLKPFTGYGGEQYYRRYKTEVCENVINKKRQRRLYKQELQKAIME
jgi:hypothetical protein